MDRGTVRKNVEFYSKNKLEKLVHLVCFIIGIHHELFTQNVLKRYQMRNVILCIFLHRVVTSSCYYQSTPLSHYTLWVENFPFFAVFSLTCMAMSDVDMQLLCCYMWCHIIILWGRCLQFSCIYCVPLFSPCYLYLFYTFKPTKLHLNLLY